MNLSYVLWSEEKYHILITWIYIYVSNLNIVLSLDYCLRTVRITEAFGLPQSSLFSIYKVMLLLYCFQSTLNSNSKSHDSKPVTDWLCMVLYML